MIPHLPLARKFRPQTFEQLIGQDIVKTALENSVRMGRILHNVIFTGVRGTGKTTLARLYAKCLTCVNAPTATPCGECDSCQAVARSNHEDVMEIDGASNTSVDDIRALRETVSYAPQRGKYKIYIIDEVHMLSQSAFNALLKTLEEPPAHVSFMFATTELHKIPQTILSRCQVFHLQKFNNLTIADYLSKLLESEKIDYEIKALQLVAAQGKGSLRDALTFLDQVIVSSSSRTVDLQTVENLCGHLPIPICFSLFSSLVNRDAPEILKFVDELQKEGPDFSNIIEYLAKLCRFCFVARELAADHPILLNSDMPQELQKSLIDLGRRTPILDLNRLFRIFVACRKDLDGSELDKLICENHFLEWCLDPGLPALKDFLTQTRKPMSSNGPPSSTSIQEPNRVANADMQTSIKQESSAHSTPSVTTQRSELSRDTPKTGDETAGEPPIESWEDLVTRWRQKRPLQARLLEDTRLIHFSKDKITVAIDPQTLAGSKLLQKTTQEKLSTDFAEIFNYRGQLQVLAIDEKAQDQLSGKQAENDEMAESLTEKRLRLSKEERVKLKDNILNSAPSQLAKEILGSQQVSVEFHDGMP